MKMRSGTVFPLFFALGLSLLPEPVVCAGMPPKETLATFGPSIGQVSKTASDETTFQPSPTASTIESSVITTTNATTVSPGSAPTVFGTAMGQSSAPGNGQTALEACPGPTQIANSAMEATVQIQVSDFVGTVTVFLTQTGSSVVPLGNESGSIAATSTEKGSPQSALATRITDTPRQSNNSSSDFVPRSNWTAGYNMTNGSFVNSPSSPRMAFTVFTGDGVSHMHVPGMFPFLVFNVAVVSLL